MTDGHLRRGNKRAAAAVVFFTSALAAAFALWGRETAGTGPEMETPRPYAAFAESPPGSAAFSIRLGRDRFFPA